MKVSPIFPLLLWLTIFVNNTQAQNVGIGQSAPIGKLHVTQTSTATIPAVIIDQPGATNTATSGATGSIGVLINSPAASDSRSLQILNSGIGRGAGIYMLNAATAESGLLISHGGSGQGIVINHAGSGNGQSINHSGTGRGLYVATTSLTNASSTAQVWQLGDGRGLEIISNKVANIQSGLIGFHYGNGRVASFQQENTANNAISVFVYNRGTTVSSDGVYSGTFSTAGARGVVGSAYINGGVVSAVIEGIPVGVEGVAQSTGTGSKGVSGYGIEPVSGSTNLAAGGYFAQLQSNLTTTTASYVGVRNGGTNYKVLGVSGAPTVSTSREDHTGKRVILFASESPMPTYTDYGTGRLVNGKVHISIDPAFANMIYVNPSNNAPLRVIIQLEGDCNGVFVSNKSATSFDVTELKGGHSNVAFTYQIVGNSKDYTDPVSGTTNKMQDLRFPELDKKLYQCEYNRKADKPATVRSSSQESLPVNSPAGNQ